MAEPAELFNGEVLRAPFLTFKDIASEVACKKASESTSPSQMWAEAFVEIAQNHPQLDTTRLCYLWQSLIQAPFNNVYQNYLNHPIRVTYALQFLDLDINQSLIETALCHNLIELMEDEGIRAKVASIRRGFLGKDSLKYLEILNIDRRLARTPEYLDYYYGRIEEQGSALCALKAVDKADNYLGYLSEKPNDEERRLLEDYVKPLCASSHPVLWEFLDALRRYKEDDLQSA